MTKTVYVIRDGELVEKVRPQPEVKLLPWDGPRSTDLQDALKYSFQRLCFGEFKPTAPAKPATPRSLEYLRQAMREDWKYHPHLRPERP